MIAQVETTQVQILLNAERGYVKENKREHLAGMND